MAAQQLDVSQMYQMFQNKLQDFLDDLRPALGTLPEYNLLTTSMKFISPEKNYAFFNTFVAVPYGARLIAKDEGFFLDSSFAPGSGKSDSINLIVMVKEAWSSLSAQDRDAIWAHLSVLMLIRDRIQAALGP
jgi:hypothetical protein